jgi:hypothetical protein
LWELLSTSMRQGEQGQTEPQVIPRGRKSEKAVICVSAPPPDGILYSALWKLPLPSSCSIRSTIQFPSGEYELPNARRPPGRNSSAT